MGHLTSQNIITDGFHVSRSSDINITSSRIGVGDDCVSIGAGNTNNIAIFSVYCGPGHSISVGSLGKYDNEKDVAGISLKNCMINSTTNGLRIKTWPGPQAIKVYNITFEDIKMINVSNPIIIDQKYCPGHSCDSDVSWITFIYVSNPIIIDQKYCPGHSCNSDISSVELNNIGFRNIKGTSHTAAVNIFCSPKVPCKNIHLSDINLTYAKAMAGDGFIGRDLTVENAAGPDKHQVVALRSSADLSAFYRCSFVGYQDTLYVHTLRQFYKDCDIYGTIDFIHGNAIAVLQNCNLYARRPNSNQQNIFTAQGRECNQNTGISIISCKVAAAADLLPVQS